MSSIFPYTKRYSSRKITIVIQECEDGTAFIEVWTKYKNKHGVYRFLKANQKWNHKIAWHIHPSHFLIDYAKDYGEYYDCMRRLQRCKCARKWFRRTLMPFFNKYGFKL